MSTIKVSIGLPVYNGEFLIREALDSLLGQSFTDIEIIISDNNSEDGTEAICREYSNKDSRVVYFRQEKNIGAANNFRFVLGKGTGKYFMWAAHDDYWDKKLIENSVNILDCNLETDFIFPSFKLSSTKLGLFKKMPIKYFEFINESNVKKRVIGFANLHHCSHKANLVYSLFRIESLRKAYAIQDVTNDGLMCMVILKFMAGKIAPGNLFQKRYKYFWPGFFYPNIYTKILHRVFTIDEDPSFKHVVNVSMQRATDIFPEYKVEFSKIRDNYTQYSCSSNYEISRNLI